MEMEYMCVHIDLKQVHWYPSSWKSMRRPPTPMSSPILSRERFREGVELACKPGSVIDNHSSGACVTTCL